MPGVRRSLALVCGLLCLGFTGSLPLSADQDPPRVRVAFVSDGPSPRFDEFTEHLRTEILALTRGEFEVTFPDALQVRADWSREGAVRALNGVLERSEADVVITLGVLVTNEVAHRGPLPKPTVALFVVDRELQEFPFTEGTSGVPNLAYITSVPQLGRILSAFQEVASFRRLAVLVNRAVLESVEGVRERIRTAAQSVGVEVEYVPVETSSAEALATLSENAEAVLVTPMLQLPEAEFDRLVEELRDRNLPTFSVFGRPEVERGLLASITPETDYPRLARRVALYVQRILLGEEPAELPVEFSRAERLTINMETVRRTDTWPDWSILREAELLDADPADLGPPLSLGDTVRTAVSRNLDLQAERFRVESGTQDVREARAALLPQIETSATHVRIDSDRAAASLGAQAESATTGALTLTQILYSEPVRANLEIQRKIQESREADLEAVRLDVGLQAAASYLNLLRARTLWRIQKENLDRTRRNLELAQARERLGIAVVAEVYRWESELARSRQDYNDAVAASDAARIALNRILHRPQDAPVVTAETGLEDPELIVAGDRLLRYTRNPKRYRIFVDFLVEEGLHSAPELQGLEAALEARGRSLEAARRAFWAPEIALQGRLSRATESGAGSDPAALLRNLPISVDPPDQTDWSLALSVSLPLFQGGARSARALRAGSERQLLEVQRDAAAERVEQRIRSAMARARVSRANIELSRQAAEAAGKNLDLVTETYSRGAASILDLIDAQNADLVAGQLAANAVYDFLLDLMEVERAIGRLDFLVSRPSREAWLERLETWFQTRLEGREP